MSKWKCPECGSHSVQISLPCWFYETEEGALEFIGEDFEADPMSWFCEDCDTSGQGEPDRVRAEDRAQRGLFDFMLAWPGEEGRT